MARLKPASLNVFFWGFRRDNLSTMFLFIPLRNAALVALFLHVSIVPPALSPLNLPLLKTDQDFTCLTWLELLAFFSHMQKTEAVVPFKTLETKSARLKA